MKTLVLTAALTMPLPGGLVPVFADYFHHFAASATGMMDGHAVWQTSYHDGTRTLSNNHEIEYYADAGPQGPFSAGAGGLTITARPAGGLPAGLSYESGLLTTQQRFSQTYGYFAICAQLPAGRGFWPAFWLLPSDGSWPPEIDVMEMLGGDAHDYFASIHGGPRFDTVTEIPAPDLTAGFHVFAMSWRPDNIRYYLDGVLVNEVPTPPDMHKPMYLVLNLAVGGPGSWPGVAEGVGVYRVAWVKAWQFKDLR